MLQSQVGNKVEVETGLFNRFRCRWDAKEKVFQLVFADMSEGNQAVA